MLKHVANPTAVLSHWRTSLLRFLGWFEKLRAGTRYFHFKIFAVFAVVNLACYWWALLTTYPDLLLGYKAAEYVLTGFPVALLGAAFDCLSLLVTLFIVRRAIDSNNSVRFLGYLSIDLLIAVLATFWVLFVFMLSGWLVGFVLAQPETIGSRSNLYQGRLMRALLDPLSADSLRNIYFGIIMGASALIPTLLHIFLACRSIIQSATDFLRPARTNSK